MAAQNRRWPECLRSIQTMKTDATAPISLILGGALGNVIDRLLHGYVVDFLQFHWSFLAPMFPGGYFPSFNIADSAITLGAIGLIADELLRVRSGR